MRLQKMIILALIGLAASLAPTQQARASAIIVKMGPASLGTGGSNPLGIPPSATDLALTYVTDGEFEFNLGLPGLLFGQRYTRNWGGYIAVGGGVAISANGAGPAAYSAFGLDTGGSTYKFNIEYQQTIGVTSKSLISPYAVRIGAGIWF